MSVLAHCHVTSAIYTTCSSVFCPSQCNLFWRYCAKILDLLPPNKLPKLKNVA